MPNSSLSDVRLSVPAANCSKNSKTTLSAARAGMPAGSRRALPGIGPRTASELVISVGISDFPDHEHLASYCGIAPRNRQSGTSLSSACASRQGNKRLKNLLVFSCNSLVRSSCRFGGYYRRCRERGMCHGGALKATARKRLKVIYAIMRDKVPYSA